MSSTTTSTHYPQAGGKLPSEHDGFAIASLVTAFFVPILAIIFGHLSNHRAKLAHRGKSALAVTGLVLGYVFTGITALIIVMVVAVSSTTTPSVSANAAPPASSAPASSAAPAKPAAPSTYNLPVGKTITITNGDDNGSNWTVTVNSIRDYTPGEYDSQAPAGQHYIVANVAYKATAGQADPNPLDWEAKTPNGQTYQSQVTGNSTELQSNNVAAGNEETGNVYLSIPNGSTGNTVVYSNGFSESGSWAVPSGD
jgi:hypothetical protein